MPRTIRGQVAHHTNTALGVLNLAIKSGDWNIVDLDECRGEFAHLEREIASGE